MIDLSLARADRAVPRYALSIREAAKSVGLSEGSFRDLLPEIPHVRVGRRVIIPVDGFRAWLSQRSNETNPTSSKDEGGQP